MTKKNLKPQQAAPVQREINTTSSDNGGITPSEDADASGVNKALLAEMMKMMSQSQFANSQHEDAE